MRRTLFLPLLLVLLSVQAAAQFNPGCSPLKGQLRTIARNRTIDQTCPRQGSGQAPSRAQNRAKNNFCASNTPVEVTVDTLRGLDDATQEALTEAGIPFGVPTSIPPNRDRLEKGFNVGGTTLREGMAVFIRAFVLESHYSNLGNGENVNCSRSGKLNNDIHVALAKSLDDEECESVTAEISPHKRPTTWADFDDYFFTHPVLIMGHLFYDASHTPCPKRPARVSSWEIHPVYSIFVCKNATLAACPADLSDNRWVPFHRWVLQPDDSAPGHHGKKKGGGRLPKKSD